MRRYDQISSIFLLISFAFVLVGSLRLPVGTFKNPGSGLFLLLTGILTIILSGALLIRSFLQSPSERKESFWWREIRWYKIVGTVLALLAYALILEWLGFLFVTFLLMFFLLKSIGSQTLKLSLGMTILITLSAYLLFKVLLKVQLPIGPWGI